uniref:Uncharacterized protein n=1 Tax=Oryzias melastigma TaxID=30732 RepID=A0A3B3BLT6_ORYME
MKNCFTLNQPELSSEFLNLAVHYKSFENTVPGHCSLLLSLPVEDRLKVTLTGFSLMEIFVLNDCLSISFYQNKIVITLLQVLGSSGRLYTCFLSCHFCPCPAFSYTVLRRTKGLLVSLTQTPWDQKS